MAKKPPQSTFEELKPDPSKRPSRKNPGESAAQVGNPAHDGTTESHRSRARGPLTAEQKIALVHERIAPMRQGRKMAHLGDLARQFGRDEESIAEAFVSAFREELVDIDVVRKLDRSTIENARYVRPWAEAQQLAEEVQNKHNIPRVLVVPRPDLGVDPLTPALENYLSDELHRRLGFVLAMYMAGDGHVLIQSHSTIGFGSGRGVYYTCKSIAWEIPQPRLRATNLTLLSLTGAVHARDHAGRRHAPLDSDFHCGLFGMFVSDRVTLRLISQPIAHHNPQQVATARAKTWLNQWDWGQPPKVAVVGVGVLSVGHRFYEQAKLSGGHDPILTPIIEPMRLLVALCDEVETQYPGYSPVADICNNLFFVEPPSGVRVERGPFDVLIDEINSRLLNVSAEQLQKVEHIFLCAATAKKGRAIRKLLESNDYNVTVLCCTDDIAQELLR